jgi:NADPH-dependent 2,4-dienoyl-CoA reductase/sulfur reductase-like enzyme
VTLVEAADRLGGTAWFSQLTTPDNGPLVDWLVHEVTGAGVEVRLGSVATVETIRALAPDVVVVATGAARHRPPVPGAELPHVLTGDGLRALLTGSGDAAGLPWHHRVLTAAARRLRITADADRVRALSRRWMPLGRRVVVVGGGLVGLELAIFVAARRRAVTVLEPGPVLGLPMASPRRWTAVRHAGEAAVSLVRGARLVEITPEEVVFEADAEVRRLPADSVVVAGEVHPGGALAEELRTAGFEVHVVGDAGEVGYLEGAIHSAWQVARRLS